MSKVYGFGVDAVDGKIDLLNNELAQNLANMFGALLHQCGLQAKFYLHVNPDQIGFVVEHGEPEPVSRVEKMKDVYKNSYESFDSL
jgi:hypothetical protein